MRIDETQAHAIVLAQVVESIDTQGKLLSDIERDQIDSRVARDNRRVGAPDADIGAALTERAKVLLETVRGRNQAVDWILASAHMRHVSSWLVPLFTLICGVAIDRVVNPRRVDLLSEPFLGLLLWNLIVYLLLIWAVLRRGKHETGPLFEIVRRWFASGPTRRFRRNSLGMEISASFYKQWLAMTAALAGQRLRQTMHLAAAAWGAGMALSLILRGTVRAYTVGWESTLWDIETVHRILGFLSLPLVKILGVSPFSVEDIARLQFDVGAGAQGADGSRWLWLYVGILALFVVFPRLGLALLAAWRSRQLANNVQIDTREAYFQRIVDNLVPASVSLGVLAHDLDDRTAIQQVLVRGDPLFSAADRASCARQKLIDTERGDSLWMVDISADNVQAASNSSEGLLRRRGSRRLWNWRAFLQLTSPVQVETTTDAPIDVIGHVVSQPGHLVAALPLLQQLRRPVLILVRSGGAPGNSLADLLELCELHKRSHDLAMEILAFDDFAKCWVLERNLLNVVARRVPRSKARGCARLVAAWQRRNRLRFAGSMTEISGALGYAIRQFEEIPKLALIDRARSEKRRAQDARTKEAMACVLAKVKQRDNECVKTLKYLHGVESDASIDFSLPPEREDYLTQTAVSTPTAVMGGAGTGAAMGASIDAMVGGMTLGAAAALGALTGGGVALASALWSNRDAPNGRIRISLSDAMLISLIEAYFVRYLLAIHYHRGSENTGQADLLAFWISEVHSEVNKHKKEWIALIVSGRKEDSVHATLDSKTALLGRQLLLRLYPTARIGDFSETE